MLHEVVDLLAGNAPVGLTPAFAADWRAGSDDAQRLRVIVDQVASLTDNSAVALHRSLVDAARPGVASPP